MTEQATDTSGAKEALKTALVKSTAKKKKTKFRPLTATETTALVSFTRKVDAPTAPAVPTATAISITTAGRQHYGDAGKARPTGTLATSDYALKEAVVGSWGDAYETPSGKWRIDLGDFETPRDRGGKDTRPWCILVAVQSGYYTVTHYGPTGAG